MADNELAKYLSIYKRRKKEDEDELGGAKWDMYDAYTAGGGPGSGGGSGGGGGGGFGNAGGYVPPSNALAAFAQGQIQPEPQQQEDQGSGGGGQPEGPAPGPPGELSDIMSINNPGISVATGMPLGAIAGMVGLSVTDAIADLIGSLTGGRTDRVSQSMAPARNDHAWSQIPARLRGISEDDYTDYSYTAPIGPNVSPAQEDQNLAELTASLNEGQQQSAGPTATDPNAPAPDREGTAGGPGAPTPTGPSGTSYGGPSPGPGTGYGGPDPSSPDGAAGGEGGSNSGDAAGCWSRGTPITMDDGTTKPIEDIRVGDMVRAFDERSGTLGVGQVTALHRHTRGGLVNVDGVIVSDNHRVVVVDASAHVEFDSGDTLTALKWMKIGELKAGDMLVNEDGSHYEIASLEKIPDVLPVFNFTVMPQKTYVAAGWKAHNIKKLGGLIYNRSGEDMVPENEDDTRISAQAGEFVVQKPAVRYYGSEIMDAINAGEIPREVLEAVLAGDDAELMPRNNLRSMALPPRGRNALAEFAGAPGAYAADEYPVHWRSPNKPVTPTRNALVPSREY